MERINMPEHDTVQPPANARNCPFDWCTELHRDDWVNDEHGSPIRWHTTFGPAARPFACMVVSETRHVDRVEFGSPLMQLAADDGDDDLLSFDRYEALLRGALAAVSLLREATASVKQAAS